jgi:hypothetical protein
LKKRREKTSGVEFNVGGALREKKESPQGTAPPTLKKRREKTTGVFVLEYGGLTPFWFGAA